MTKRSKKDKERNLTVVNWLFAQTTYAVRSKYCLAWWVVFHSYKFQVLSTSAERLPSCEGSKFGWSHYLGQLTTAILPYGRDYDNIWSTGRLHYHRLCL